MDQKISDLFYQLNSDENLDFFMEEMKQYLSYLKELRDNKMIEEDDYRSGWDTYGYESRSQIIGQLKYISDRWSCAFRINWLLGLLDPTDYISASGWENKDYNKVIQS